MELRLENLIADMERTANIQNMDSTNPIVFRITNPAIGKITAIVASLEEPVNLVLPINVTWFDYNPLSYNYRKALRRVSKDPDALTGTTHTWEVIDRYADVFVDQVYDSADQALLSGVSTGLVPASDTTAGVARLSQPSANPNDPVVVVEGDPRLTDDRNPLPHTHPQLPATELETSTGTVTINASAAPQTGYVLVATSPTSAVWRALTTIDIVP